VATADKLLAFLVKQCGVDILSAVSMLTAVPAKILNLAKGVIAEGFDADLAVFDDNFHVTNVFVNGVHQEV
jgi:N-acetylglucosamine-6-phosphate deacetylase